MERRDGPRTSELDLLDELTLERNAAEEQHCQAFQVRVAAEEAANEQRRVVERRRLRLAEEEAARTAARLGPAWKGNI